LNRYHSLAPRGEYVRERSATRAYLDDGVVRAGRESIDNRGKNLLVGKKVLAELLERRRMSATPAGRTRHAQLLTTTSVRSSRRGTARVCTSSILNTLSTITFVSLSRFSFMSSSTRSSPRRSSREFRASLTPSVKRTRRSFLPTQLSEAVLGVSLSMPRGGLT